MGWLSSKRKSGRDFRILLDVGSGSVGGAVIATAGKRVKPYIYFTTRVPIASPGDPDHAYFISATLKAVREVGGNIQAFLVKHPKIRPYGKIVCVLASPWYAAKTVNLRFAEENEFTVSTERIQKILDSEDKPQSTEETSLLQERFIEHPAIFERRILNITLNGYPTAHPLGKKAKRIEVSMFTAVMELSFYQALGTLLEELFNEAEPALHSHVLSAFTTVRDCFGSQGDFLLLDVTRRATEVTLVLNDGIERILAFPLGTDRLATGIARHKNGTKQEASSLLVMAGENKHLDKQSVEQNTVSAVGRAWKNDLLRNVESMVGGSAYPHHLFLTAPVDSVLWFKQVLSEPSESTGALPFSVTPLIACLTQNLVDFDSKATVDSTLALETLHVARI